MYVKGFELTNINYALNYCFFLNKLELDEDIDGKGRQIADFCKCFAFGSDFRLGGRNVFKSCVSRIVYLTGEKDQILGKLNAQGQRIGGLIDKFSSAFSVADVISYVAADTNSCGDTLEACRLYALADVSFSLL